jgi:SAM-dependent methyltransferase
VPDIEANKALWIEEWDWSGQGDEWSVWWGGTEAMWLGALLPRIHPFVPTGTILEIAPGYGRWTQYLKDLCERLVLVDLAENCIAHCKRRFEGASNIDYHVNDGRSLDAVADRSVDFAFSFDSLVHVEADVLSAYLEQLARKLRPDGVGFFHHSNMGSYRTLTTLARRTPWRLQRPLAWRGVLVDVFASRAETVSADVFAAQCEAAGLACVTQEKISWERGHYLIDTMSVFTPKGSRWQRPRVVVNNPLFRWEARRMAKLYARTSFRTTSDQSSRPSAVRGDASR